MKKFQVFFAGGIRKDCLLKLTVCLFFIIELWGCTGPDKNARYLVGFSQTTLVNQWRKSMLESMERELSFHPEISFVYRNADGSSRRQVEQIQELIDLGVDLLIVSPNEAEPVTAVVEKAYAKGIKVIILDRRTLSDHYTAYVGASNYEVGATAANFANSLLKGKGKLLEVSDIPGSSADIERHKGFSETIADYPGLQYVAKVYEEGDERPSNDHVTAFLKNNADIQLIFAQNDRLAFSSYNAVKKLGLENRVKIVGVDGLAGENGGINLVEKGILKGTVLYPTGGEESILTALNILEGKPFAKNNLLTTTIIDSSNVRIMRLQAEKMLAQQQNIDRSQQTIEKQAAITRSQANTIYIISFLLALAIILGGITWFYLRENRKINKQLESQNAEILDQQQRLIEMSARAKEASEARFNFFTNISHEFRTPLTLILAPLEEMMSSNKTSSNNRYNLQLIQRNVIRLLRLVNQLIDFRKIELNRMEVKATPNNLVDFINEIVDAFKNSANKKSIDLRFFTAINALEVWFDVNMLDKVMYNLLSNALKFTRENGYIYVSIELKSDQRKVLIKVEDNGVGMNQEEVDHAFDLYYQGGFESFRGSGIGLSLSKELVELHQGEIRIDSKPGKGSVSEVTLLLGNEHLPVDQRSRSIPEWKDVMEKAGVYLGDLSPLPNSQELTVANKEYEFTIAIIEDNIDLLNFINTHLSKKYYTIPVSNGLAAVKKVFDELPDLIISDIMLPGKDGLQLTEIFKKDVRTAHIPILLLTAKTSDSQQIEGLNRLADAYMPKPFNVEVLENNVSSLLRNRKKVKDHFTTDNLLDSKLHGFKKADRKFVADFTSLIEANLSNETFKVDDICNSLGISRVHLYRKVKATLGVNVNEYILNSRLQKAKYYLQHEHLPVSDVAYKVGFSSPAYFSTVFKAKYEITPSEFREQGLPA